MDSLEPSQSLAQYNEARYRVLAEESGVMITLHRPGDWAYIAVNPAVEKLTGMRPEELLGRPVYEIFHPDDALAMKHKLIPAIKKHGTRTFRYRTRNRDGEYRWVESTHRSVRDPETGALTEIVAVTRDVQQEVEAEQALKRLADVVEASGDFILFCDRQLQVQYLNAAALNAWGLGGEDKPHLKDLMSLSSYQKLRTIGLQLAEQNGRWQGAIKIDGVEAQGRYWQLEQLLAPAEHSPYYSLIIRDRSEQKCSEAALKEKQEQLTHSARLMGLGEMASGLAHEINQPLASLLNYARGALRKLDKGETIGPERLQGLLQSMEKQAQRAANIIERLRAMVKKTPYRPEPLELGQSLQEARDFIGHELEQADIRLQLKLPEQGAWVRADKVQLQQVWLNLFSNAIDALSGLEGRQGQIDIELQQGTAPMWLLSFRDNGPGIAAAQLAQIFEPYVSHKPKGLGLGLAISRSIIESWGGHIEAHSDAASYSCISVRLPALMEKK
ncbi:MAG: PAS domain S-box protein [Cellvibrionaceae bacterium]|nr:PAS domain S-box protein [Cellvibrionaceae bacterium]